MVEAEVKSGCQREREKEKEGEREGLGKDGERLGVKLLRERERVCKHQKTLKPKARGQAWRKRERKRVRIKTAGVMM